MATATLSKAHAEWFEQERGITADTLLAFGVYSRGTDVLLPYTNGEKTRPMREGAEKRFYFTEGKKPWFFNARDLDKPYLFVVEGETDTMILWQELGEEGRAEVGVVGLPGVNGWQESMVEPLRKAQKVWFILDNDEDYNTRSQVDTAWLKMRKLVGPHARRLHLPNEVKDVAQFFDTYDLAALRTLVETPGSGRTHYQGLDFSAEPPPVKWLWDSMMARGDIVLTQGEPNAGKSLVAQTLAVAVAEGWPSFLGHALRAHGRVLYVDQENPEDVARGRMAQLGLTEKGLHNMLYLWEQGVSLDRHPDKLLDEAVSFEPTLIVLDSLVRLHSQDENSNMGMALLGNEAIKPLARETGATVIVLHHTNKGEGSSMKATRGAVELNALPDTAFHVLPFKHTHEGAEVDAANMLLYKTRRGKKGRSTPFMINEVGTRLELNRISPEALNWGDSGPPPF